MTVPEIGAILEWFVSATWVDKNLTFPVNGDAEGYAFTTIVVE